VIFLIKKNNFLFVSKQVIWRMKYLLQTIVLSFFMSGIAAAQTPAATIPGFTFFKFNKTAFTNKDLASGKIVFFVFFDTECDHCQHAIEYLNQHQKELDKAAVYLISVDGREKVAAFLSKHGSNLNGKKNILLLQDTQNEFILKFKPRKYPSLFLYSPQKKLMLYDDDEKKLPVFLQQIKTSK
jgi:cytochrome oxidase Cu insertion factor (SCO1/SenC/PrrC family)